MRKEIKCSSCVYHGVIPSGGGTYCDYFSITGHLRPCKSFGPGKGRELHRPIDGSRRAKRVGLTLKKRSDEQQ